jgi:hypothetical protein
MWVFVCLGCDDRWMDATRHRDWFVIDQQVQGGWSRRMFNSLGSLQLQFGAFLTRASCLQRYTTHNLPWVWDGGSFSQLSERAFKRILLFMKFGPIYNAWELHCNYGKKVSLRLSPLNDIFMWWYCKTPEGIYRSTITRFLMCVKIFKSNIYFIF